MTDHDDHHHDHSGHGHEHGERYTGDFDEMAKTWDADPAKVERARVVGALLPQRLDLGPTTRVFEYGAGTGLVSQMLAPHVGPLTLADPSEGMRAAMAAKVAEGTLPAGTTVVATNFDAEAPGDDRFDLVVTVQVMHHVPDLAPVLAAFATILEPGGHLAIVDLEAEDGSFHGDGFGGHHGFHRPELQAQLEGAGFTDVRFEHAYDLEKDGHAFPLFLALATR
ncbi:MAG: class I SAM-dependent methyltransferase [Acidimicrobiales bacterium]